MAADTEPVQTEADRVEAWRLLILLDAGYSDHIATLLAARSDIDLHAAVELVAAGCTHLMAARILL